jgi:hypothetical protein
MLFLSAVEDPSGQRIQRILAKDSGGDAHTLAAREILLRGHPFDRSNYLRMHAAAKQRGEESPFTERIIRAFEKKHVRFCFPGYKPPANLARGLFRRMKKALLH